MKKKTTKREIKDLFTGLAFIFPSFLGFLIFYADSRYHFFIPELQPMELHGGLGCDQVHRT